MKSITVDKSELIKTITENRSKHREIFEEALEGYKNEVIATLETNLEEVRNGRVKQIYISLPCPEDHTRDYDRVLKMLELHLEDHIDLSENDVQQYVQDDWSWKRQFLASNAAYSETATVALESYS